MLFSVFKHTENEDIFRNNCLGKDKRKFNFLFISLQHQKTCLMMKMFVQWCQWWHSPKICHYNFHKMLHHNEKHKCFKCICCDSELVKLWQIYIKKKKCPSIRPNIFLRCKKVWSCQHRPKTHLVFGQYNFSLTLSPIAALTDAILWRWLPWLMWHKWEIFNSKLCQYQVV